MIQKKTILLIDDEEDFCHFIKLNLEYTGKYKVLLAHNGEEGLNMARTFRPDLILLDLYMPGLHGSEVASALVEDEKTRAIPILFVTAALKSSEIGARAKVVGGRVFITKPVSREVLFSQIEAALEGKRPPKA
jgi:CheY-like chemotaxis protein